MPQGGNRRHLRGLVRTFAVCTQLTLKAAPQVPTIGRPYLTKNNIRRGVGFPSRCLEFTLCSPQGTGLARALRSAKRKVQAMQKTVRILHISLQKSRPVHLVHGAGLLRRTAPFANGAVMP